MKLESLEKLDQQFRPEAWLGMMAATIALTLAAAYLSVFKGDVAQYRELSASWSPDSVASAEARVSAAISEIAQLEQALAGLEDQIYGGSSALPLEQMESHIIARLDDLSAEWQVRLSSVKPGPAGRILEFDELPYDIDVAGGYFALFDWLSAVESDLRPLVVKRFQLTPTQGSDEVRMQLRLVSYRPTGEGR